MRLSAESSQVYRELSVAIESRQSYEIMRHDVTFHCFMWQTALYCNVKLGFYSVDGRVSSETEVKRFTEPTIFSMGRLELILTAQHAGTRWLTKVCSEECPGGGQDCPLLNLKCRKYRFSKFNRVYAPPQNQYQAVKYLKKNHNR
jgi:hypothetical protein